MFDRNTESRILIQENGLGLKDSAWEKHLRWFYWSSDVGIVLAQWFSVFSAGGPKA